MSCRNCDGPLIKNRIRHGLCEGCYQRWRKAGYPDQIPARQVSHQQREHLDRAGAVGRAAIQRRKHARKAVVAQALAEGQPLKAAARRAGVDYSTAAKYRRELIAVTARQQQGAA